MLFLLPVLLQVSKKYVPKEVSQEIHDKAAPFVKWLKEADEESSESEEESDDDVSFFRKAIDALFRTSFLRWKSSTTIVLKLRHSSRPPSRLQSLLSRRTRAKMMSISTQFNGRVTVSCCCSFNS